MNRIAQKKLTDKELGVIVNRLINDPGEIDDAELYEAFLDSLANVITEYCGGAVTGVHVADGKWLVSIGHDENVPEYGGIYAGFDKDNPWPDEETETSISPPVAVILNTAREMMERRKREGWTREDLVEELLRFLDSKKKNETFSPEDKIFIFSVDQQLFKTQRSLLTCLLDEEEKDPSTDYEPLEGIRNLLDTIADQAHDWYGMDTLFCLDDEQEFEKGASA